MILHFCWYPYPRLMVQRASLAVTDVVSENCNKNKTKSSYFKINLLYTKISIPPSIASPRNTVHVLGWDKLQVRPLKETSLSPLVFWESWGIRQQPLKNESCLGIWRYPDVGGHSRTRILGSRLWPRVVLGGCSHRSRKARGRDFQPVHGNNVVYATSFPLSHLKQSMMGSCENG